MIAIVVEDRCEGPHSGSKLARVEHSARLADEKRSCSTDNLGDAKATTLTEHLLAGYRLGHAECERRLFEREREALLARASRHRLMRGLRRYTTVEDVVNEVFLRAMAGGFFAHFEPGGRGALSGALRRILTNVLIDYYRRVGRCRRGGGAALYGPQEVESTWAAHESAETSPTSKARAAELLEISRKSLDPLEWRIWSLAEVEGLDSTAIAEKIGKSASAVRALRHRARHRLLRALMDPIG